jgi:hypothetical protein
MARRPGPFGEIDNVSPHQRIKTLCPMVCPEGRRSRTAQWCVRGDVDAGAVRKAIRAAGYDSVQRHFITQARRSVAGAAKTISGTSNPFARRSTASPSSTGLTDRPRHDVHVSAHEAVKGSGVRLLTSSEHEGGLFCCVSRMDYRPSLLLQVGRPESTPSKGG